MAAFQPDVVFCVDWSSLPLYRSLAARMGPAGLPAMVYLNYRVFSRTEGDEKLLVSRCAISHLKH